MSAVLDLIMFTLSETSNSERPNAPANDNAYLHLVTNNTLTSETLTLDGKTFASAYVYDINGFMTSRTLPSGRVLALGNDGLGRASSIASTSTNGGPIGAVQYASAMTYHPSGALASMTYGNGQAFTQTLNARLLPDHTRSAYGTNVAMDMAYTYDTRGKVTSVINTAITGDDRAYSYDALGRLLTASGAWGDGSYTYDALGNIRNKTVGGIELLMSYDSSNRLVSHTYTDVGDGGSTGGTTDPDPNDPPDGDDGSNGDNDDAAGNGDECPGGILIGLVCYPDLGGPPVGGFPPPGGGLPPPPGNDLDPFVSVPFSAGSSATGPRTLSYDSRGNVTALGGLFFTYDMSDQPTAISGNGPNGVVSGTYTYDGNLKRVRSVIDGKTIYNVYDAGGTLIHILKLAEGLNPEQKTDMIGKVARVTTSGGVDTITYLHNDHLGSANTGTDSGGLVLWREQYTPFGSTLTSPLANNDLAGFTGHIKDSATGLNYMQARYYDPLIGRFLSRDPIGFSVERPEMFGSYTYVNNDPVNGTDPDGEFIHILVAGAVGAVVATAVNAGVQYATTGKVDISDALIAGGTAGIASAAIAANPALAANPAAIAAIAGAANVTGSVASDVANSEAIDGKKALVAGAIGLVAGPAGAKIGGAIENAAGASASSLVGEVAGAIVGESLAAGVSVGTDAASNAANNVSQGVSDLASQAGQAMKKLIDNPTGGPNIDREGR